MSKYLSTNLIAFATKEFALLFVAPSSLLAPSITQ